MNETENKVKEYIERGIKLTDDLMSNNIVKPEVYITIAQMLQREEHFNKSNK